MLTFHRWQNGLQKCFFFSASPFLMPNLYTVLPHTTPCKCASVHKVTHSRRSHTMWVRQERQRLVQTYENSGLLLSGSGRSCFGREEADVMVSASFSISDSISRSMSISGSISHSIGVSSDNSRLSAAR